MKKEVRLVRFRFLQIFRALKHLGWTYVVLILPFLFISLLFFLEKITQIENKNMLLLGYIVIICIAHTKRSDLIFLNKVSVKKSILFILEYSFLCSPYSMLLLFLGWYNLFLLGHLGIVILSILIANYNFHLQLKSTNWSLKWIPNDLFEWKGSIRMYHYGWVLLWGLGLFMATHELAYFMFVFMFAGVIGGAFKPTEGKELKPTTTKDFYKKVAKNSLFLGLMLSPHFVMYLIYNNDFWYVLLGIMLYFFLFQCYCIFFKYANYVQYRAVNNDFPVAIFIFLCPFLPFSLILLFRTFSRAKKMINYA